MQATDEIVMVCGTSIDWYVRSWWLLCPTFGAMTARLAVERACADPYDLLPAVMSSPRWAWPLALLYVVAHLWIAGAYLLTVSRAQALLPPARAWREVWDTHLTKVVVMAALLIVEYAPVALWRTIGVALGCSA